MRDYERGSLSWDIARTYERRRELACGNVHFGYADSSREHFVARAQREIAAIDEEFAEAVALLRDLGLMPHVPADEHHSEVDKVE